MCVWKVKNSISGKEKLQLENVEVEIKDESNVGDIFNNRVEDNIYILVQGNSLTLMKHQEEYAEHLGKREVQPVEDLNQLAKLMFARKAFLNKLKEEGKDPLAFIGPGIVDSKPTIIVCFPDKTAQIRLPATFEGYPVLYKYGVVQNISK